MCLKLKTIQNITKDKQEKSIYQMILKRRLEKLKKDNKNIIKKTKAKFPINENLINLKQLDVKNKDLCSKYKK